MDRTGVLPEADQFGSKYGKGCGVRIILVMLFMSVFLSVVPAYAEESSLTRRDRQVTKGEVSLIECVRIAILNSFEVKKAKLDLYISETDLSYSESVFDAMFYGGTNYTEDKSQKSSIFSADDTHINEYYGGITKKLFTGTELIAELSDTRTWSNTTFVSKNPAHEAELFFQVKQPIARNWLGYVDRTNISITKLAITNSGFDTQNRIENFIADVEKAYFTLVFARKGLDIHIDMLGKAKKLYETYKRNYDIGLAERVDLLASEANLFSFKAEVLVAENDYARADAELKLLMNVKEEKRICPETGNSSPDMDKELSEYLKEAFVLRRDYSSAKTDVESKGLELKVKRNNKWPEIDLTLSMAMNGLEENFAKAAGKVTDADNTKYFAGVQFEIPIENRKARGEYEKAKHEKEKALVFLKETERGIITDVGNAFGDVRTYKNSLVYASKTVELEKAKLKEEEKRFEHGRSGTKRLIDYQRDLLNSELSYARYLLKHDKAKVDLKLSINSILKKYEDMI